MSISLPALPGEGIDSLADQVIRETRNFRGGLAAYWRIPPVQDLRGVIAAVEARSAPAGPKKGFAAAAALTRSYPRVDVPHHETYLSALTAAFAEYPEHVGEAAAKWILRNHRWPPAVADIHDACRKAGDRDRQAKWAAEMMLVEIDRRKTEAAEEARRKKDREAWRAKHGDKSPLEVFGFQGAGSKAPARGGE